MKSLVRAEQKNATVLERTIRSLEHTCSTFFKKMLVLELRVNVLSEMMKELGAKVRVDLTAESEVEDFPESPITLAAGLPMGLVTLSEADFAAMNTVVSEMVREWEVIDGTA